MSVLLITALCIIVLTIAVHGVGTTMWLRFATRKYSFADGVQQPVMQMLVIMATAVVLIALHFIEILLWAFAYRLIAPAELPDLETAIYFSAVTFTSLGYGDITLSSDWRLLSGFEAIDGILLIGWTTAFMFAVLQRTWGAHHSSQSPRS